jgi:hypothetical protein
MKTKIGQTYLPVFPGFYGTYFEPDEAFELESVNIQRQENDLEPLEYKDLDFDYEGYKNNVCEASANYIEYLLFGLNIIKKIKFEKLYSPIEYNFANDSIDVEIEFFPENLSKYINEHFDSFKKYIKDNYTSHDGFLSYYSNDAEDWKYDTENFTEFSDSHRLGSCLEFVCLNYYYSNEYIKESGIDIVQHMYNYVSETVFFGVKDYEFETKKVKCPICGEFYLPAKEQRELYDKQVQKELALMNELGVSNPDIKSFEQWSKENEHVHCN